MDLRELLGLGAIPAVIGIVELLKPWLGRESDARRWYPVAAVLVGAVLQVWMTIALDGPGQGVAPAMRAALIGVLSGLSAAGLYSARKNIADLTGLKPG